MRTVCIDENMNGYSPKQCGKTMTVGELMAWLGEFDAEAMVYLRNNDGHTYGSISKGDPVEEEFVDGEGDE